MWTPVNGAGLTGTLYNMTVADIVASGYDLGLMDYPIWDESRRQWLNERIVEHFALREIACETPTQFVFYLNRKMAEVMPWLNVVFESNEYLDSHDKMLNNEEIFVERSGDGSSESKSAGEGDSRARAYSSNDPTVSMVGRDEVRYFDTGSHSDTDTRSSDESEGSFRHSDVEHRKGHYGRTLSGAVEQYVTGHSNSLRMLFRELEPLFCQVLDLPGMRFENPPSVYGGWWPYAGW